MIYNRLYEVLQTFAFYAIVKEIFSRGGKNMKFNIEFDYIDVNEEKIHLAFTNCRNVCFFEETFSFLRSDIDTISSFFVSRTSNFKIENI